MRSIAVFLAIIVFVCAGGCIHAFMHNEYVFGGLFACIAGLVLIVTRLVTTAVKFDPRKDSDQ